MPAFRPDDRRHQRCLHHGRGYPLPDGYLVRQRRHPHRELRHHQSLDAIQELRLRHPGAGRIHPDVRHLEPDGLRRLDHQGERLGRLDRSDAHQAHPWSGRPDVPDEAHPDGAPGRGCYRPCGARLGAVPGTGCFRLDADAGEACRRVTQRPRLHRPVRPHR